MILDTALPDGTPVQVPGIIPKLGATPGAITAPAPELGAHTDTVLAGLGIDADTRADWRTRGIL
jgi:formyl-CoA transferase